MTRTRRRPLPAHQVEPERAVVFGLVLGVVSVAADGVLRQPDRGVPDAARDRLLRRRLHDLAEALDAAEHRHRRGGRCPPAGHRLGRGHRAASGIPALLLFALVFYWTPPHFWALSLRIRKDYAAAGVPMLPVVKGIPETTRQIGLYTDPDGRDLARALGGRADGRDLPRRGRRPRRDLPLAGLPALAARRVRGGLDRRRDPRSTSTRSATCRCCSWPSPSTRWC